MRGHERALSFEHIPRLPLHKPHMWFDHEISQLKTTGILTIRFDLKLSFLIAFTKHTHTYRRRKPKVIEGFKRRNPKDKTTTFD